MTTGSDQAGWLVTLSLVAVLATPPAFGQSAPAPLPQWRLSAPRQSIGGESLGLHRVRGAGFLSDGRIVIADGGNTRVLIVSRNGALDRSIGRAGSGPGDFRMLWDLAVVRDTILTYDTGLLRISLWRPDGEFIRSVSLAVDPTRLWTLRAFSSPSEFIITTRQARTAGPRGLYTDTATVLRLDGRTGTTAILDRRAWEQQYFYPQSNGSTAYGTPFLGRALLATAATRVILVPLASARVEILRRDGSRGPSLLLPVPPQPFARSLIDAFRDSLVRLTRKSNPQGSASELRLLDVFGSSFPLPVHRPVVEFASAIGNEVWLRAFPTTAETAAYYVIDAARERLAGRLDLPAGWRVLGGNERSVLVLQRDSLDVESVVVYDVTRVSP